MRLISGVLIALLLGCGAWWLWTQEHGFTEFIEQYTGSGEILTLEARYSPEQIMEAHKRELLADNRHVLQEPTLKFYPYLLMEVKYSQPDKKTREGVVLWGMESGEMVLNTTTWETTHGFEDCILAGADRNDFKIINAITKNRGSMTHEELQSILHVEADLLDEWLESAREKHLVIQKGSEYFLHFQNPKLQVAPQTRINQWLVTKPYSHAMKVSKKYSKNQIEKTAKAAFGGDFAIRNVKEIFLPVFSIEVLNPDGSILTSYWNALNGQRIHPRYLTE